MEDFTSAQHNNIGPRRSDTCCYSAVPSDRHPAVFVFWQPVLTAHSGHTLATLARISGAHSLYCVRTTEHAERRAQGWKSYYPENGELDVISGWGGMHRTLRILVRHQNDVHVFGSPFENWLQILALLFAVHRRMRVYIISEPYSSEGVGYLSDRSRLFEKLKALLRPLLYRLYGRFIARQVSGVFAISSLAVRQYAAIGVPREKIFPFGYFLPVPSKALSCQATKVAKNEGRGLKAVFVGNLIRRKGLDHLLAAVREANCLGADVALDVYGAGDPAAFGSNNHNVCFRGLLPFGLGPIIIASYDLLILPSRYDGWGVVVNEAIMAGVPILASNRVGASGMLTKWGCGIVFDAGDVSALASALVTLSTNHEMLEALQQSAQSFASVLTPEVAGRYMLEMIVAENREKNVQCPWYDC